MRSAGLLVVFFLLLLAPAQSHPLGNFTTNHFTRLTLEKRQVRVHYVLDLAEIPTFSVERALDRDGKASLAQLRGWARAHARSIAPKLILTIDGIPVQLALVQTSVAPRPGAGGLPTLYFTADYIAPLSRDAGYRIVYRDTSEQGRLGWKDVVIAPGTEPTHELHAYPNAIIGSPRARSTIAIAVDARGIVHALADPAPDALAAGAPSAARMNDLSDILAHTGSAPLVLLSALLLAIGLGALHALEPGHGKTLLAVSLVGARATPSQALILASSLTLAHTIGVLALGLIVLFAARWIVPEQIYPWITLLSGVLVAILGARALRAQFRRNAPHEHTHGDGTMHDHATMSDAEHARAHAIPGAAPLTYRTAVLAAAGGNLAPCPAALVVLLAAISLHRIGFGLVLIVAFSVGLAATLTALGIAVVRSAAWISSRPQFDRVARYAPVASAVVIAVIGTILLTEGIVAQGLAVPAPAIAALVVLAIAGYCASHGRAHTHAATDHVHA